MISRHSDAHRRGNALLAGLLFPLGLVLIAAGAERVWMARKLVEEITLPLSEYVTDVGKAGWVRLLGCELDLGEAIYRPDPQGNVSEVYIPLREPGVPPGEVKVLLFSRDPRTLALLQDLHRAQSDEDRERWARDHAEALAPVRVVQGCQRPYLDLRIGDRLTMLRLDDTLARDVVILDEHFRPNARQGWMIAGGGAVAVLVSMSLRANSLRVVHRAPTTAPSGMPVAPPIAPPEEMGGRRRRRARRERKREEPAADAAEEQSPTSDE
jgi:hypothetical protein